ncbi:hypothetical protein C8F01DRAFT_1102010 [Mycena amicta]|nr:hypothetical protein C8F01DRAFT_1102010 [Mycena amicta]
MHSTHSFNSRHGDASSHRRCTSEPFSAPQDISLQRLRQSVATPVALRPKRQSTVWKPRPMTEIFGSRLSPNVGLGSPRVPTQLHPKTRIGQPVLKLAAVKERLEDLENMNERLQQRIESYKTDIEMLNSSVSYFSSEYYSGLLTIRDLRGRAKKDAEVISTQEQQLCQLKKFVGLMVELGLHEPVLVRAHGDVLKGKEEFEPKLVDAIRNAASRPGSAWSQILSSVAAAPPQRLDVPIQVMVPPNETAAVVEETHSPTDTVDDLLKSLKNGDITSSRHQRFSRRVNNKTPGRQVSTPAKPMLYPKTPKTPKPSASLPNRAPLTALDANRASQIAKSPNRKNLPQKSPTPSDLPARKSRLKAPNASDVHASSLSNDLALASLQRILDHFSSGSLGSLEMTDDSQSTAEAKTHIAFVKSPIRIRVRPPKRETSTTPKRVATGLSLSLVTTLGSPYSPGSPLGRRSRVPHATTSPSFGPQSRKAGMGGWR